MSLPLETQPQFILVHISNSNNTHENFGFIQEEVKRANEHYDIVTEEEEKELTELYEQKLAAGEDAAEVQDVITNHIRYMCDIYHQAREISEYAKKLGVDLPIDLNIDLVSGDDGGEFEFSEPYSTRLIDVELEVPHAKNVSSQLIGGSGHLAQKRGRLILECGRAEAPRAMPEFLAVRVSLEVKWAPGTTESHATID
ncbi:hypothetical protein B0H10DRAFT_2186223 [Mycena sp. CBHHK59/15]|nr:hypothetical protein B0H10DRAFT_2186223 [Mycena sp. CBHHK59/15]